MKFREEGFKINDQSALLLSFHCQELMPPLYSHTCYHCGFITGWPSGVALPSLHPGVSNQQTILYLSHTYYLPLHQFLAPSFAHPTTTQARPLHAHSGSPTVSQFNQGSAPQGRASRRAMPNWSPPPSAVQARDKVHTPWVCCEGLCPLGSLPTATQSRDGTSICQTTLPLRPQPNSPVLREVAAVPAVPFSGDASSPVHGWCILLAPPRGRMLWALSLALLPPPLHHYSLL